MAASVVLNRGMGPWYRCMLLAALVFVFIGSVHYLEAIPRGQKIVVPKLPGVGGSAPGTQQEPTTKSLGRPEPLEKDEQVIAMPCNDGSDHLKPLGLSRSIRYSRKCIKPVFSDDVDRDVVANISSPLTANMKTLKLSDDCPLDLRNFPCDPIELPVPRPAPPNEGQYAHLVFGVATTYDRLRASKPTFAHWLAHSGSVLVGLVADRTEQDLTGPDVAALEGEYAAAGVTLRLRPRHDAHDTTEQSHLLVLGDMLAAAAAAAATARWFGVLDDDTFVPSLPALAAALAAHDHARPAYLGQLTEHAGFVQMGVLGAFGGAGVFLSAPLARELEPHLDGCAHRGGGGDMLIMACVHAHSAARLTRVPGLWQVDLVGDPGGFYESGRRMLTMHHWKSWSWLPVLQMAAVVRVCGDCFLQRFAFPGDGRGQRQAAAAAAVLNNGYSINEYGGGGVEDGPGLPDLSRTEQTWSAFEFDSQDAWQNYEWSLGPLRPRLEGGLKKSYLLATAFEGEEGQLAQVYVHRAGGEGRDDEVIELVWQRS